MDWETCNYMHLIGIISNDDIDKMIDVMINNCDNNGKCYESYKAEEFLMTHVHNPNLFTIIDEIAHKEIESEENKGRDLSFNDLKEINSFLLKKQICDGILRQIEKEARKKRDYRFFLRLCFGEVVDFEACVSHHPFLGKVEFYKDGSWGIAETDGVVLVKNHLIQQPSEINHQFCGIPYNNIPYRIIQDRDTMKYGIISYESFCETIYCHYDKISICKCCEGSIHHFYIKVKKGVKWGCFDENCALVVDCKYDEIRLVGEYLECSRDCKSLIYDTLEEPGYDTFLVGKKDLYDGEGNLLIGGYDHLDIYEDYFLFYFGTTYERYNEEWADLWGTIHLSKLKLNYDLSLCLVLDRQFNTLIQLGNGCFQVPWGIVYNSIEELEQQVPADYLFMHYVDLSHLKQGIIMLHDYRGEQYILPKYIEKGFDTPEEMDIYVLDPFMEIPDIRIIDDEIITIIKIDKEKKIIWQNYVNELSENSLYYRKESKIGFFYELGFKEASFDAITRESPDGKTYVAHIERCKDNDLRTKENPNKIFNKIIHYYYLNNEDDFILVDDDWNIFNPTQCKWYPSSFIDRNYDILYYRR